MGTSCLLISGCSAPWNSSADSKGGTVVASSVLEAIKSGVWDFEPEEAEGGDYTPTSAMPGTGEKLEVLAERIRRGFPLWHNHDRRSFDDPADV